MAGLKIVKSILKNKIRPTPIMCQWFATLKCNYNCSFCNLKENSPISEATTEEIIEIVKVMSGMGVGIFYVVGGEPLLRNDLRPILAVAKERHMITILSTNGSFIDKRLDLLPFLDYVRVSLHSLKNYEKMIGTKNPNSLKKVLDNIKVLKNHKVNTAINMVVTEKNIDEMEDITKLAENLGVKINFTKMMEKIRKLSPGKSEFRSPPIKKYSEQVRYLKKKYKTVSVNDDFLRFEKMGGVLYSDFKCKAADVLISLNNDGKIILPCGMLPLKKIDPKDLKEKWKSKELSEIRNKINSLEACRGCSDRCAFFPASLLTFKGFINILRGV